MKTPAAICFALFICASSLSLPAFAADPDHTQHQNQSTSPEGMQGGNMHGKVMQHMMSREQADGDHKGYAEMVLQHIQELKLTDEQIGKITRIHQESQQKVAGIVSRVKESMKAAHNLFLNPAADEAAIRKAAQEHSTAFNELVETTLKARNAINAVLTPEQLQKLKSLKSES
ncbi:Spy/CpxP family protein refolding chaperone [Candidatus Methylospira mobilis]|nr:Spy/CpxP family protein refolding chaperone [Candidatus Methylospira mobilis]WNV04661.1 Spy/CpxP family protein refolding chaperone [Candidatus Methylospira mobilis]